MDELELVYKLASVPGWFIALNAGGLVVIGGALRWWR